MNYKYNKIESKIPNLVFHSNFKIRNLSGNTVSADKSKKILARKAKIRKKQKASREQAKIQSIPKVLITVLESINPLKDVSVLAAAEEIREFHNRMIENHQVIGGTKRYNDIRLYAIRLLEGQKPEPLDRVSIGKKDRWPSAFNKLRPWFYAVQGKIHCQESDRIIRSLLYLNRLARGNSKIDLSQITKEFTVSQEFRARFRNYLKTHVGTVDVQWESITKPTLRVVSNGPNGQPKWLTAGVEAYVLMNSDYAESFRDLCDITYNNDFYEYVKYQSSLLNEADKARIRYITSFPDKGNKSRVIAICDYWTQTLLKPLMDEVKRITRQRFGDLSSSDNHNRGFQLLLKNIREGIKCYDIVSWTEAHPAILQRDALAHTFGDKYADLWYKLVVSCYWSVKSEKDTYQYKRGQGMGTNGSFDIATYTNLEIMNMIYLEDYNIKMDTSIFNETGDDQWNFDPDHHIVNTLTNEMGMDISITKVKEATKENLCAEYVSRNINYGKDVSKISANIARAVKQNILDLPELTRHIQERTDRLFDINLRQIFKDAGIKKDPQILVYIRVFYLLCKLFPERPGMRLLMYSLVTAYTDIIASDEFIRYIKNPECLEVIRVSYISYSSSQLLDSIVEKCEKINENVRTFCDYETIKSLGDPSSWWLNLDESIEVKTSKMALSQSYEAHLKLFDSSNTPNYEQMFERLERIEQSLSFKELGIIQTDKRPLKPTTSRLYKIVKSLECLPLNERMINDKGIPLTLSVSTFLNNYKTSLSYENKVMLPSVHEKYLGIRGKPILTSSEDY